VLGPAKSRRPNRPAGHAVAVFIANNQAAWGFISPLHATRRSQMPKMKTKSAAKKRFKITATGKVLAAAAGKRHGMIKRSNKFIRDARGTMVLAEPDGKKVIKNYLPNGL
jgi:large subunit ribosomal protein L35